MDWSMLTGPGLFSSLFGGPDPSKGAMPYLEQISGKVSPYYDPYINAGKGQLGGLENQYSALLNDPGAKLNQMGAGYQQSPGYQFALQQALAGGNQAAAAGGMAGSPMHQQQNMQLATNMANQDYYNYLDKTMGLYGQGLQGSQGLAGMGQQASGDMAKMIAQALAGQAGLKYAGQASQNQARSGMFGNLLGGIGSLAAFL